MKNTNYLWGNMKVRRSYQPAIESIVLILIKIFSGVLVFLSLTELSFGQNKSSDGYLVFYEKSNTAKHFKMSGNASYLDYFLENKVDLGDQRYQLGIRKYSWGDVDTAYYREDEKAYYHYDLEKGLESMVLPKSIIIGQKWYEADNSWSYKVIDVDRSLKTPAKKYKGLIVVECLQVGNQDKEKNAAYHLFYAKGIGMVASMNDGELGSYLTEIKVAKKEGDMIGK